MLYSKTGASACVQLNQFKEAITWCDKGLAVSFTGFDKLLYNITNFLFLPFSYFSFFCNTYNIHYKDISHLRYDYSLHCILFDHRFPVITQGN